jgi:hypothetical protein
MNMTPGEFMELQNGLNAKDIRIAQLETEVAQLEAERDLWKERALAYCGNASAAERTPGGNRFIVISQHKLRSLLEKIRNVKVLSLVAFVLQKALPNEADAEEYKALSEVMPVPELPNLSLTADGDIEVNGDWNDVHDNEAVNF